MKKAIIRLFIVLLTFTCFSYAVFLNKDEEDHPFHVHVYEIHAIALGDDLGVCPDCGTGRVTVVEAIQPPDCVTPGTYFAQCDNYCGYMTEGEIPAPGHSYQVAMPAAATCTEGGIAVYTCSRCGESYEEATAALGHNYQPSVTTEATCTAEGLTTYTCSRCGDSYTSATAALGHNYTSRVTREATCEEDGVRTYTCTRCGDRYTRKIDALGHDFEYEEKEATCTEAGYKNGVCKNCGKEVKESFPALGHDLGTGFKVTKEATCTEDGVKEGVCKVCGETVSEAIAKTGHKYPEEWTVEKEAGFFSEGLESKTCPVCNDRLEQAIPKKSPTPLIISGSALALVAGGLIFYLRRLRGAAKKVIEEVKEGFKPKFEDKTILSASKYSDLVDAIKEKSFLEVVTCENEEIKEKAEEAGPDLIIVDVLSEERLESLIEEKKEDLSDYAIGVVTVAEFLEKHREELDALVKDKTIVGYVEYGAEKSTVLVKLILPILKPDIHSDETLENLGAIADALGIPGVSSVIDVYISGRDIKSTLEEGELGVSGTATIISDMASILGFDTVASVAGLVDDVDSIKAMVDKEAGAYERKGGIDAAKDIVEVVSDLIDKG